MQPQPKLGAFTDELDRLLGANAARSARDRVTLMRIFEELRELGYEGGYDAVRRYAASWRRRESSAVGAVFVQLSLDPGEAYQFDWSHEIVLIGGTTVTIRRAHMRLCHSRMPPARQSRVIDDFMRGAHGASLYAPDAGEMCSTRTTRRSPSSRAPARRAFTTI